jgi:hypothetical protein
MRCPVITLAIAAVSACSGSHRSTTPLADQTVTYTNNPTTPETQVTPAPNVECPFDVAGADVLAEPIDDGIALVFTTDPEHVGDVRAQVRQFAGPPGVDRAMSSPSRSTTASRWCSPPTPSTSATSARRSASSPARRASIARPRR